MLEQIDRVELRKFLGSAAGVAVVQQLRDSRPPIKISGAGIDNDAVAREASFSAGWEACITMLHNISKDGATLTESGYRTFVEPEKKEKSK